MTAPNRALVRLALGVVYVVWGSTYLAIAYAVESLPPLLMAAFRSGTAALLLLGIALLRRGRGALVATPRQWWTAVLVGVLLLLGGNGGVVLAEDAGVASGVAALVVAVVPLFVVLLRLAARDRPSGRTLVGVGVGFVGVAVLLLPGARPEGMAAAPMLLLVGAALSWSVGSFVASRRPLPADPLAACAAEMAGGAVGLLLVALARGEEPDLSGATTSSLLAVGYLVVFGSVVAFTAYSWLLGVAPVSTVATYAYVNPVVAVGLGALLLDERLSPTVVVGGGLTVLAVAVVVAEEGRRRPREPVEVPVDAPNPSPATSPDQGPTDLQGRERSSAT